MMMVMIIATIGPPYGAYREHPTHSLVQNPQANHRNSRLRDTRSQLVASFFAFIYIGHATTSREMEAVF